MKITPEKITGMLAAVVLAMSAGCAKDHADDEDFFQADPGQRLEQTLQAQISAGAKSDATLRAAHFDGASLNSLGQQRLTSTAYLVREGHQKLYVNLDEKDELTSDRLAAVGEFLETLGYDADAVTVAVGTNPNNYHIASLTSFYKVTESRLGELKPEPFAAPSTTK